MAENEDEDFKARPYQVELLEEAKKQNTILYLPTGSGKTFVAIMLIKELSPALDRPYINGGKRTFFMVNTVALVAQQAKHIRRHVPYEVGEYSGDMNVDFWAADRWSEELKQHHILVMTSQIFLNMLLHNYTRLENTNLLIFDECHHGVNDHPMRQIMQRFESCPLDKRPRVLGLSATLIMGSCKPHSVMVEVENLERTYHSKIATVDNLETVKVFSTNPKEVIRSFLPPIRNATCERAKEIIVKQLTMIDLIKWPEPVFENVPVFTQPLYAKVKTGKQVRNQLNDLLIHIDMLGLYGGSRACLAHLLQLERKRVRSEDDMTEKLYGVLTTSVSLVHKLLSAEMAAFHVRDQIQRYSSDQVISLIDVLEKYHLERLSKFCCVVFVQRRFTAKVLYQILLALATHSPERYGFILPDFMVGLNNNPQFDTREGKLDQKHNSQVITRFNRGDCNLIVSSNVLEEGIDIPRLSLVVMFDKPGNHSSYIQSKGRARHETSWYVMMVPQGEEHAKFTEKYHLYRTVERLLQAQLVGQSDHREAPSQQDISNDMYQHVVEPYYADPAVKGGPCITMLSSVSLLNRYCSLLPHDKFTELVPLWFIDNRTHQVTLQLPMCCPVKELIKGRPNLGNRREGKRSAAMEACIKLHQAGELDNKLLPMNRADTMNDYEEELFPLWKDEETEEGQPKPGTKRYKRRLVRPFPEALSSCRPAAGEEAYLHAVTLVPAYPQPTLNRRAVFYSMLCDDHSYAILSSKRLPKTCSFSIYLNVGEVTVSISSTPTLLRLDAAQISALVRFNAFLFNTVLGLDKAFLAYDVADAANAHVMVPTLAGKVDWDTVSSHTTLPPIDKPSVEQQKAVVVDDGYLNAVIAPWYRGMCGDQTYVVTRVCPELSPLSPFPSKTEDITYAAYFSKKYGACVLNHQQPLVEVKAISNKLQCLKPRPSTTESESRSQSKRRRELNDDFEEHLVAELCIRFDFPAVLWLKATCLPSVLHRLYGLLLAEELRVDIARTLHIGCTSLPPNQEWRPLVEDAQRTTLDNNPESLLGIVMPAAAAHRTRDATWRDQDEPVDIERMPLEAVRLIDIQHFENYINRPLEPTVVRAPDVGYAGPVAEIAMLANTIDGIGPQQSEILQALTATTANDVVNLERCETLGDSFLKLAVSHYLYIRCSSVDEGRLTHLKGRLLGNRNLLYCGLQRNLGGLLKVHDFAPKSDFVPPGMCVPRFIAEVMYLAEIPAQVLYKLNIPLEERTSGLLSEQTLQLITEQLLDAEDEEATAAAVSTMEVLLGYHTVKDKTVADCVEALIGTYLKCCGVRGALLLLGWLRVLPADQASPQRMYDTPPASALLRPEGDVDHHLRACGLLEKQLGYTFKDRSFLLQALTHPSFEPNRITETYERLEFLGDALLDFLVTCHIYERCGSLSPGELTDLRSSLVNNVYFACVAVRNGFHQYMLASSPRLLEMVDRFVAHQEERHHLVNDAVMHLVTENETEIAEAIDVPKVLGDLFESLAGAIYLDSNMCLKTVWAVFYRLMHNEITEFSQNVPKQPVRRLHEYLGQNKPIFHPTTPVPDSLLVMVTLEVKLAGSEPMFFHGFGENKVLAKTAAAKIAMKKLPGLATQR